MVVRPSPEVMALVSGAIAYKVNLKTLDIWGSVGYGG